MRYSTMTDAELVRAAASDDCSAFGELVLRWHRTVLAAFPFGNGLRRGRICRRGYRRGGTSHDRPFTGTTEYEVLAVNENQVNFMEFTKVFETDSL